MADHNILQELRDLTHEVMKDEGVDEYDLTIEGQSEKGDNYAGDIIYFTVRSNEKKYNLVMKTAKRSKEMREILRDGEVYRREMFMYSKIFPTLSAFAKAIDASFELEFVPKVLWVVSEDERETLIMENLKTSGYKLWDRSLPMDLEHVLLALKNYGKFHAISVALNDQKPELFQQITKHLTPLLADIVKTLNFDAMYNRPFKRAVKLLEEAGQTDLAERLLRISNDLESNISKVIEPKDTMMISHGDCWTNNMLFQYKNNTSTPKNVCFVDFQLSSLESPVKDLSYFIYACCDKSTLSQFDLLLKTYYESFASTLRRLGSSPENLFTFEQLEAHWKTYSVTGLILAVAIIRLELSSVEEAPHLDEFGNEGNDGENPFDCKIEKQEEYNRRIMDVFTHFAESCL